MRGDGRGRQTGWRADRRHQDRGETWRRSGLCALPAGRVFNSPARVPRALTPCQYMECEISFRLTRDLPARDAEYSEQEVFDALEACAAFELVDSRFRDLKSAMDNTPYEFYADHIANGAMVFGSFRTDWQSLDFG